MADCAALSPPALAPAAALAPGVPDDEELHAMRLSRALGSWGALFTAKACGRQEAPCRLGIRSCRALLLVAVAALDELKGSIAH